MIAPAPNICLTAKVGSHNPQPPRSEPLALAPQLRALLNAAFKGRWVRTAQRQVERAPAEYGELRVRDRSKAARHFWSSG